MELRLEDEAKISSFVCQRIYPVSASDTASRAVFERCNATIAGKFSPVFKSCKTFRCQKKVKRSHFCNAGNSFLKVLVFLSNLHCCVEVPKSCHQAALIAFFKADNVWRLCVLPL